MFGEIKTYYKAIRKIVVHNKGDFIFNVYQYYVIMYGYIKKLHFILFLFSLINFVENYTFRPTPSIIYRCCA